MMFIKIKNSNQYKGCNKESNFYDIWKSSRPWWDCLKHVWLLAGNRETHQLQLCITTEGESSVDFSQLRADHPEPLHEDAEPLLLQVFQQLPLVVAVLGDAVQLLLAVQVFELLAAVFLDDVLEVKQSLVTTV